MKQTRVMHTTLCLKNLETSGIFSGYASVFDVIDAQNERIRAGAFVSSLKHKTQQGNMPHLLWQHQIDHPIGVWESIKEDSHGLWVKGRLLLNIQKAQEAYTLIKEGVVRGLSIGFHPVYAAIDPKHGIKTHYQVDLVEVSLVTLPANPSALIHDVKQRM